MDEVRQQDMRHDMRQVMRQAMRQVMRQAMRQVMRRKPGHVNTMKQVAVEGTNRTAVVLAVGAMAAIAGAATAIGAEMLDRAGDGAELVAGMSLFASAMLAVVVCLARTRIEMQRDEIDRLRTRTIDAEIRAELLGELDEAADRFVLRESER